RPADDGDAANLAARQGQLGPVALAVGERRAAPGAAADLAAATRLQLHVMDRHAQGGLPERQAVADPRAPVRARRHRVPGLPPLGGEDVGLLAVRVLDEGDPARPVRVVLDREDVGRDAVPPVPLEVDQAVHLLVPAAAEPDGDHALVVPAALLLTRDEQRLLRFVLAGRGAVGEIADGTETAARGGRLVEADAHVSLLAVKKDL